MYSRWNNDTLNVQGNKAFSDENTTNDGSAYLRYKCPLNSNYFCKPKTQQARQGTYNVTKH